jgi:hypothetical protein
VDFFYDYNIEWEVKIIGKLLWDGFYDFFKIFLKF